MREPNTLVKIIPFFLLSLFLLYLSQKNMLSPITGIAGQVFKPFQQIVSRVIYPVSADTGTEIDGLKKENADLRSKLNKLKKIEEDNSAFRDQFIITSPRSQELIPAAILGMRSFIPGVSLPEELVLDKGEKDGVHVGTAAIYKESLIGQVVAVTPTRCRIALLTHTKEIFTARTQITSALGSVKADGDTTLLFGNVLLTEKLEVGDYVITKGDQNLNGQGLPPGLVIGKITSVNKQPSNLFQSAEVETQIDVRTLSRVFLLKSDS